MAVARRGNPYRAPKIYKAKKPMADGLVLTQWVVDMRLHDGKRRRLFFDSESEANIAAKIETNKLANEGLRASQIEPGLREEAIKCKDLLNGLGATLEEAVRFFLAHRPTTDMKTLEDAIEHFIASRGAKENRSRSVSTYQGHLNAFKGVLKYGRVHIHEISTQKIEKYFETQKFAPKTRNNHLGTLKTFFLYCSKRGWCRQNPAEPIEKAKIPRKRPVVFTPAEARALVMAALNHYLDTMAIMAIGLFSGVRSCELMKLEVHMIKLAQRIIDIPAEISKTGQRRLVPISDNLAAWLVLAPLPTEGRVFQHGQNTFYKNYVGIRAAAGVMKKANGMRHSFATYHLALYSDVGTTSRACGHSIQILLRDYDAVATKQDGEAYSAIFPNDENKVVVIARAA
jgi:integrase